VNRKLCTGLLFGVNGFVQGAINMITVFIVFGGAAIRCLLTQQGSDCELFSVKQLIIPLVTAETIFEIGILRILRKKGKDE
jgi:hypothetical protein